MSRALRRAARALLVVLFFAALTVVMTWPQSSDLRRVIAAHHDALFSVWRLAWVAHQLPRDPAHLFDGNIFHPEPRTLAFSDAMLVPGLLGAPFLWVGGNRVLVYNGLLLAAFILSGAAMFLLVRRLTGHAGAGLLAGVVFAFVPYRFEHYFHLELQWALWMPLGLWALHRTLDTRRLRDGVLTGLFLALQMLSSLYYGVFFATYLAVFGAVLLIGTWSGRTERSLNRNDSRGHAQNAGHAGTDAELQPTDRPAQGAPASPHLLRALSGLALGVLLAGAIAYPYTLP
jgi:hypothetical protein